jgi:hypothetical protein
MISFFRLAGIAVLLAVLSACGVTPERYREARLMPEKVALQIVARHAGSEWARNPTGRPLLANHPLCSDKNSYPMPYETMFIGWDVFFLSVSNYEYDVGFWCGSSGITASFKNLSTEDRDDLVDAFTSLGAKLKVR